MEACHARLAEPQSFVENPVRNGVFSFTPNVTALAGFSNSYFLTENLPTPSLKFVPFPLESGMRLHLSVGCDDSACQIQSDYEKLLDLAKAKTLAERSHKNQEG